jgi:hypothetical protein
MSAWRTLPLGEAGSVEVALRTDDDGRLVGAPQHLPKAFPHLAEVVERTRARIGRGPAALDPGGVGAGLLRLQLTAHIEKVAVPEGAEGVAFGLRAEFHDGKGRGTFTLPEGRRITIEVAVLGVQRDAR